MKRIISLLIALSTALTLAAQGRSSTMLRLRLSDRSRMAVELDGRYIDRNTSSLTLDGLRPGLHRIEVYHTDAYRRRPVRIYTGTIRLNPGTVNTGIVDVNRRMLRLRREGPVGQDDRDYGQRDAPRNYDGDESFDHAENRDDKFDPADTDEQRDDRPSSRRSSTGEPEPGYGSFPRGRRSKESTTSQPGTLSQSTLNTLAIRVKKLITDTEKEKLMKAELKPYRMSTNQVRTMLAWLAFESTRLDFAIWAYDYTADRENFRRLEDAFELEASKAAFRKAIPGRN